MVRRQERDDYVHVMQLDNGNSQVSLACVHFKLPLVITLKISYTPWKSMEVNYLIS